VGQLGKLRPIGNRPGLHQERPPVPPPSIRRRRKPSRHCRLYFFLTALSEADLFLGVVWYLNEFEESNNDGGITDYAALRNCNDRLYSALQSILRGGTRSLAAIEQSGVLPPGTRFFSVPVPKVPQRHKWLAEAGAAMQEVHVVFLDPDNGLPESPNSYNRAPAKYASFGEVAYFRKRQQTVIVYQHQTRTGTFEEQLERHCATIRKLGAPEVWVMTFHRVASRAFIVIPAEQHAVVLEQRCRQLIQSPWGREGHFRFRIHEENVALEALPGSPRVDRPSSQ